jgi:hypothetical protein
MIRFVFLLFYSRPYLTYIMLLAVTLGNFVTDNETVFERGEPERKTGWYPEPKSQRRAPNLEIAGSSVQTMRPPISSPAIRS